MTALIEQVETCPYCECENVFGNWDPEEKGYIATCWNCGKEIFLCDACLHAEDNPGQVCDWKERRDGRGCMRGWIKKGE